MPPIGAYRVIQTYRVSSVVATLSVLIVLKIGRLLLIASEPLFGIAVEQ
jgi:hypothetical protein